MKHQKERDELEKNMTLKRDMKKENLTRKMLEHERWVQGRSQQHELKGNNRVFPPPLLVSPLSKPDPPRTFRFVSLMI